MPSAMAASEAALPPNTLDISQLSSNGQYVGNYNDILYLDMDGSFDAADASLEYPFDESQFLADGAEAEPQDGEGEVHEKRQYDQVEEDEEDGGGKRREGETKTPKKPGRKLATVEPTTKRKAQNRAAQRAFRERKEKHLKDLEDKVQDLQAASESANHENSRLRAQVEKMSAELREYKRRLGVANVPAAPNAATTAPYVPGRIVNNPNDVDFQFEFPKFGRLPGPSDRASPASTTSGNFVPTLQRNMSTLSDTPSPISQGQSRTGSVADFFAQSVSPPQQNLNLVHSNASQQDPRRSSSVEHISRTSSDPKVSSTYSSTNRVTDYSSPSISSMSNGEPLSSCGTSPEPSTLQSPGQLKSSETNLTTIGEESSNEPIPFGDASFDLNGIDWLAAQNNNQFDPQLFGDYREPLDNILAMTSDDAFRTDNFFADAFALPDMGIPGSLDLLSNPAAPLSTPGAAVNNTPKTLIQHIDAQQNADEAVPLDKVPAPSKPDKVIGCNTIWDRLQACKTKDGGSDLDIEVLCKDMQKKARCTESGPVMREKDFENIVALYTQGKNAGPVRGEAARSGSGGVGV